MPWLIGFLTLLAAYLVGAIPFGYLIARMRGIDIFEHGSGNIGATNVGRVLGRKFGILVFLLDFAKGAGPVALAMAIKPSFDEPLWTRGWVEVGAGLAAFLGHCFPVYLRFRGGKGVATGAGVVLVLLPTPMMVALAVWIVVLCAGRMVSLASIAAVVALCVAFFLPAAARDWTDPRAWFCLVAGGLTIARHHANIVRLAKGTENQLRDTLAMRQLTKSLHVLSMGMWFGMSVFFSFVVAFALFSGIPTGNGGFETAALQKKRESWFPRTKLYSGDQDGVNGTKEQGSRAAGYVIGPIFTWYFALQGACGFIALATALPWMKRDPSSRVHRLRVNLLIAAIGLVLVGWWMERRVHELREPRNQATEIYLADRKDESKTVEMQAARAEFTRWHLYSVFVNLITIVMVTGAMAMAGNLETAVPVPEKPAEESLQEKREEPTPT
ncbi:MAG TPA: glycerol-3-phosphate 1-O-acyltransferase PlsY [Gemmataceae bacterium]|nr:glycerol-3-phosphate 1-O-acyltransferase PlsY [Gemmataceae bacterium]